MRTSVLVNCRLANIASSLVLSLSLSGLAAAQNRVLAGSTPLKNLAEMDIEDLMNVKVTSVSKREQKLSRTAAAIFVINQEDIRRSGATTIPDLLRMAPGVDVEQIDANAWAISIRGFNSRLASKVLVLIDGRTVYTPTFSGVYWDHLDMPLEDIERIEVIRGPGATMWGANAVNGVISIITKNSRETKGGLVTAGGGSQLHALGELQYGGAAGSSGTYRVFGRYTDIGNAAAADGSPASDRWRRSHGGFRSDWDLTPRDSLTVQGDLFANQENQMAATSFFVSALAPPARDQFDATGGNLLARWNHALAGGSQTSLQAYYDTYRRTDFGGPETLRTFDLDFQQHLAAGGRHEIVWGLGYRVSKTTLSPGSPRELLPASRTDSLFSGFLQDEIRLSADFSLTLGWKMEHNAYSGLEHEPNVRLVWNPAGSRHTVWAAGSKAVRQPSRTDSDLQAPLAIIPLGPDLVQELHLSGNPHIQAEHLWDYEAGYRAAIRKTLSLDAAAFLSFYRHLETFEPQLPVVTPGSPVHILIPFTFGNNARATDYGGEVFLNWNPYSRWRISPGYSYLHAILRQDPSSPGRPVYTIATDFPQNTLEFRSLLNLSPTMEFDQSLYYTARLPGGAIPGHARLDLRLSKRISEFLELSLTGQNLLRPRTLEYGNSSAIVGSQAVRSVYAKITWRF